MTASWQMLRAVFAVAAVLLAQSGQRADAYYSYTINSSCKLFYITSGSLSGPVRLIRAAHRQGIYQLQLPHGIRPSRHV